MRVTKIVVFLVTSLVAGGVFWALYGSNLAYDVGSSVNGDYTFSHTEFSTSGRIIITSFIAFLAGGLLTWIWHILQGISRTTHFSKDAAK